MRKKQEILEKKSISVYPSHFEELREAKQNMNMTWDEFVVYINDLLLKVGAK